MHKVLSSFSHYWRTYRVNVIVIVVFGLGFGYFVNHALETMHHHGTYPDQMFWIFLSFVAWAVGKAGDAHPPANKPPRN